jgi:hypothetical protein
MTQAVQTAQYGSSSVGLGFKNRIINGAMVIAQRGTSSLSIDNGSWQFPVDRMGCYMSATGSKFTAQQNAGSVTPPVGFTNYLGITSTSAYTVGAGEWSGVRQIIEGFNVADLGWGTANAKTVTLSFWVRSSLTGTFGGAIYNGNGSRCYPFTYTINSANTWEYETITIAGDTSGTWDSTNGGSITPTFSMGTGATVSGPAGAWSSNFYASATGATSVVGTNGATWFVTGVQLEVGSTATSFDYRPYGTELALCQRYLPAFNGTSWMFMGQAGSSTINYVPITFSVSTRVAPTGITVSSASHFRSWSAPASDLTPTNVQFNRAGIYSGAIQVTFSSGLTAGNASGFFANNSSAQLLFTGCEL